MCEEPCQMKVGKILATENKHVENKANLNPDYLTEIEKDKWDVRTIGLPYNFTRNDYCISFTKISDNFRPLVKMYVKQRLIDKASIQWYTATQDVRKLNVFFKYLNLHHPDWKDLCQLSRNDMEGYFEYIRNHPMGGYSPSQYHNQAPTDYYIWSMVSNVENFLYFMQRYDWPEAPNKPVRSLIFQEDRPRLQPRKISEYKFMPDFVWNQVVDNISFLDPQYVPIVMLMEATGFHLIDILTLKLDCLIYGEDGTWIKSERRKVIKVPINDEIVDLVKAQQELINDRFPDTLNPNKFLFLRYKGKLAWRGQPYLQPTLLRQLNLFAAQRNIRDEEGRLFRFGSLVFRHRYGLSQINNGMSIIDVQRLIANVTPEMAVIYAKIHDFTNQKLWEDALSLDAIRLDSATGDVIKADLKEQAFENDVKHDWLRRNFEGLRLDHGYCIKSPRAHCQYLNQMMEQPCITFKCQSFYVDSTFSDYYNHEINLLEERIQECRVSGRSRLIELLEPKLIKYKEIRSKLKNKYHNNGEDEYGIKLENGMD
jgi:integrase